MPTRRDFLHGAAAAAFAAQIGKLSAQPIARNCIAIDGDDVGTDSFTPAKMPRTWARAQAGRRYPKHYAASLCSIFRARVITMREAVDPLNATGENVAHDGPFAGPLGAWFTDGVPGKKTMRGKVHWIGTPANPALQWPGCMVGPGRFDEYSGTHANLANDGYSYVHWNKGTAAIGSSPSTSIVHTFATNDTFADLMADLAAGVELIRGSFNAAHKPYTPTPVNEPPGHTSTPGSFDELLDHFDWRLSALIDEAVARGYVCLVGFDNGTSGSGKGDVTEAGICTPFFAIGDGIAPGESDRMVQATDWGMTLRELRGAPKLAMPHARSFADDLLPGFAGDSPREIVTFSSYPGLGAPPNPATLVRVASDHRFKLVEDGGTQSFYDLEADPTESAPILNPTPRQAAAKAKLQAGLP